MANHSIVVVDSEPVVRDAITHILSAAGYQVRSTGEFDTACAMLRQSEPDLVITNVFLRGIRGHEAMLRFRQEFPGVRILMISGLPDNEAIQQWLNEDGFDAFPKPFTAEELKRKVAECLKNPHERTLRAAEQQT